MIKMGFFLSKSIAENCITFTIDGLFIMIHNFYKLQEKLDKIKMHLIFVGWPIFMETDHKILIYL